jgi:hypothetical protein
LIVLGGLGGAWRSLAELGSQTDLDNAWQSLNIARQILIDADRPQELNYLALSKIWLAWILMGRGE